MVSWSYNHCHIHHWICYKGVYRNVPNPYAVVTLFKASSYCGFWWYFIRQIWSVDHIIIVIFIIEAVEWVPKVSSKKRKNKQIHTQYSHCLDLNGFPSNFGVSNGHCPTIHDALIFAHIKMGSQNWNNQVKLEIKY